MCYYNKILRHIVTNSIETRLKSSTQDIFLSRMRDISRNFELGILFVRLFPFPLLIYFFPKVVYRQELKHKGLVKESSSSPRWFGARTGRNGGLRPVQMSKPMIGQRSKITGTSSNCLIPRPRFHGNCTDLLIFHILKLSNLCDIRITNQDKY